MEYTGGSKEILPVTETTNQILTYSPARERRRTDHPEADHTSKCSFLDGGSIEHHEQYAAKRMKRGIFRSGTGVLIHADLQASYNLIKKAIPEVFVNGIEGMGLYARSLSIRQMTTSKGGC
ncbi:IS605 OrfB family transposase [mine drainage metagenome]|uniref:IS605 OrfB family transposase n=1 Tax=mine drainage metagenome TaxID=410659 RepID=T1BRH0_9ZZZZ